MKTFKTLIIDDEPLARQRIKRLLQPYAIIEVIAEASNGGEGLELINELKPDLVFLDIEMPVLNGFEMLARLKQQPRIVFTTAFDQYAIKAFEENSIDYLLKPIEQERLARTMVKLQNNDMQTGEIGSLQTLIEQLKPQKELRSLTVKIGDRILLVKLEEIFHIEAEDKYVFLRTLDNKNHLTDFTISALEEKLPGNFIRVHRSSIINADHITEIRRSFNGALVFVMSDRNGSRVTSSRGYGEELKNRFEI